MTSMATPGRGKIWIALACAVPGILVFQFLGNSTRGYIGSSSLFYWWTFQWTNPASETQHGLLILLLSVWLGHRNLGRLVRTDGDSDAPVLAATTAVAAGLAVHSLGFVAEQARVSIIGLLLFTWGVIAFVGGRRWAKATVFPIAFLVFAIPLNALDSAGFWLRMWVVGTSGMILHAVGIHVLVNGTQILSPDGRYNYDVAAACSGVRSLVALASLSLVIGYLQFRPFLLRAAMFAATFPLIYLGNVLRIVSIVISAQIAGQKWGDRVHEVMGFAVFAIVLGGVYLIAEKIASARPDWAVEAGPVDERRPGPTGASAGASRIWAAIALVDLLAVVAAFFLFHVSQNSSTSRAGIALAPDGRNPVALPEYVGSDWMGRASEVTEIERQVLPADTGFSRKVYVSLLDPSKQVFLSIVLSGRDRTSIHRPELCLVGQGWTIQGSFDHRFSFPGTASAFPATVLRVQKELVTPSGRSSVPQLFAYYFVGAETTLATHWQRLARDSWDRVAHGRSDRWAYVVVQTGSADGEDAALKRIQDILSGTLPAFQKHA
jgi:exosortase